MKKIVNFGFNLPRTCSVKATSTDPVVKNDLAITPRRMFELVEQGIPISEQSSAFHGDFIDGYSDDNLDFQPPHIYMRHSDIISNFNTQIEEREKVGSLIKSIDFANEVSHG